VPALTNYGETEVGAEGLLRWGKSRSDGAPARSARVLPQESGCNGADTTQNWLGRSQFAADPYLNGQLDNFRIYDPALSAAEAHTLYADHL
jgi:hypothetical protein